MTITFSGLEVGRSFHEVLASNLSRTQIVQYAGASGDYNPAHTDEVFATGVLGYPTVFAHGMLTMGMSGRHLADLFGTENLRYFGGRFTAQVWPGDTLRSVVTVVNLGNDNGARIADVETEVINQDEKVVFSGTATVIDGGSPEAALSD